MKAIVLDVKNAKSSVEHLVAQSFDEIIVFSKGAVELDLGYYKLNGIKVTAVKSHSCESTVEKLLKIRGSLDKRFLLVYSEGAFQFDLEQAEKMHFEKQVTVSLLEREFSLCAAICECEVLDYILNKNESFEKEVLSRVGQESELSVIKQKNQTEQV